MIDELHLHEVIDEKEILTDHRNAVHGYKWAVNEAMVWK
jgi:hypothetical protein